MGVQRYEKLVLKKIYFELYYQSRYRGMKIYFCEKNLIGIINGSTQEQYYGNFIVIFFLSSSIIKISSSIFLNKRSFIQKKSPLPHTNNVHKFFKFEQFNVNLEVHFIGIKKYSYNFAFNW